jgi:hypothetical protein
METHSAIIERLGGIRKVARELGHASHTTVQGWVERDKVPVEHWTALVQVAERLEQPLCAADLLPAEIRPDAAAA